MGTVCTCGTRFVTDTLDWTGTVTGTVVDVRAGLT
jgi:hypothetical protein